MPFTDIRRPSILDSNAVADKFKLCSKDYNELTHKPSINGCILAGDICFDDLGLPEVVACCTQAYAEGCIFPYVDNCMEIMQSCLCEAADFITAEVECLHSATIACINETKTCLACDINAVDTNLTLCIECVSCDMTSCINAVCTCLEETIDAVDTCLSCDIADINALIPSQASCDNLLADKAFVNSTVGTNTANYIKYNGGPFPSVECLEAYSGRLTNNDYAFVCGIDTCGNVYYDRYKYTIEEITTDEYTADQGSWGCEYRLNNSSFTSTQWAAIDSGISSNVLPSDMSSSNKLVSENALDDKLDNTTSPDNAGKVVGVDEDGSLTFVEGGGGGSALVPDITQDEYDELTPEVQNNGQIRHITDAPETPVPFAVVNDGKMSAANVLTAQKTLHLPTVVISANADATKTIDAYYQNNGASVKVLFLNGHRGSTFTINGKTVYANKDGQAVAVPSHTINSVAWYVQAYTTLELIYLSSLDDGNGGWLVVGNPIVLSGGTTKESYEVRANGFIAINYYNLNSVSDAEMTIDFPLSFINKPLVIAIPHNNAGGSVGYHMTGYTITTTSFKIRYTNLGDGTQIMVRGW